MREVNIELARRMLEKSREANLVQAYVEMEQLHRRNAQRRNLLDAKQAPNFPRLSLKYLRNITFGEYQLNLTPAYIQDKLQRENEEVF